MLIRVDLFKIQWFRNPNRAMDATPSDLLIREIENNIWINIEKSDVNSVKIIQNTKDPESFNRAKEDVKKFCQLNLTDEKFKALFPDKYHAPGDTWDNWVVIVPVESINKLETLLDLGENTEISTTLLREELQ